MNEPRKVDVYVKYAWDCPECGELNLVDQQRSGDTVTCWLCREVFEVEWTPEEESHD